MKMTISSVGLLSAIVMVGSPLALHGQQANPAPTGAFHGGPSYYGSSTQHIADLRGPAPYGYLWDGYCVEAAQRYACEMQHAANTAAIARQATGACAAEKFHIMKDSISSRLNPLGPCGHCRHCQGPKAMECGNRKLTPAGEASVPEEPEQPLQPESSDAAGSGTMRSTQDPVVLTPVEPSPQPTDNDDPTNSWSPRSPVVRLAPAAPEPSEIQREQSRERRVPRNVIPPPPENPSSRENRRGAMIPVKTNASSGSGLRR